MTSPTLIYRDLTLNFSRSVTFPDQTPLVMEVVLKPLASVSSIPAGATFIEGADEQEVVLSDPTNTIVFSLVPTDLAGLSERVTYRIAWRTGGVLGRTFTYDFAMPDADVTFDELVSLGSIITGEVYLQQTDLGVAGRVARLNDDGQVVDAYGVALPGQSELNTIEGLIDVERVERQQADASLSTSLTSQLSTQINQAITTSQVNLNVAVANFSTEIITERNSRISADTALQDTLETRLDGVDVTTDALDTALDLKANLVAGKIPIEELPPEARTQGVQVADETAMLALTLSQVQQFDFAIRPDGIWALMGTDPSNLAHWVQLNRVFSVNAKTGDVVLNAADVGAIPTGGIINMAQVSSLGAALDLKADQTDLDAVDGRVNTLETDTTIVRTEGGFIDHDLNDSRMAYVDATLTYVTTKDGTIITGAGGAVASVNGQAGIVVLDLDDVSAAGGEVPLAQITDLDTTLAGKVDDSDARLTDARTPTAHAASHGQGQSDEIAIDPTQVTGLAAALTSDGNRLSTLETRVTDLEIGGAPGSGSAGTIEFWDAASTTTDFEADVTFHSPFGFDGADYYLNPAGADPAEVRYAYITPNGHLELREWNESNPADPALAEQADLDALISTVGDKADASALSTLSDTVDEKASQIDLDYVNTVLPTKADQSSLDTTNLAVADKAEQSDLDLTNVAVADKAEQSDMDAAEIDIAANLAALNDKADLVGGLIPDAQIPDLPQNRISGLPSALNNKADLTGEGGFLVLSQVPEAIPTAKIDGLDSALGAKADLVTGKVPSSQLPSLALTSVEVVANKAAMLALQTTAVQPGDICVITATSDQGSYILADTDPSDEDNWVALATPIANVLSVNGQTGTVVLDAADVGALGAAASIPQSQINGLGDALLAKASLTYVNGALEEKTSTTDVQTLMSASVPTKQKVNYVATSSVSSLSGQQSVDGVLVALGSMVLLTAQPSSVLNGIWRVNSGAWTRGTDMASGSYFVKGTVVVVESGATNANTLWQETNTSGVVDTNQNSWAKIGNVAPQYAPVAGNGITITGTAPNQTITAKAESGAGCVVTSGGIGIDTALFPRIVRGTVPSGSKVAVINHGLGTNRPASVTIIENGSGTEVKAGWAATGTNTVSVEFAAIPTTGQWDYVILG